MDDLYYKQYEPIFGEWRIVTKLGEGSFGKVYEIEREDFGRIYKAALKVITVPPSESEVQNVIADGMTEESASEYFRGFVEEVVDEFSLMAKLKGNSNIVSYENHKVFEHKQGIGWDILIQMELLLPLVKYAQLNPLSENEVIKLGIDLCKALEVCHKYNVIHRDIKPDNIFVSQVGDFKLGDFGIARTIEKTTGGLSKKGTYNYMAPEVYKGEPYGYTVDIYSVGLVLYRFLNNNRLPFFPPYPQAIQYSDRETALVKRICGESFDYPVNASKKLADIVMRACAYNPANRYSNAEEMRLDLERILNQGNGENCADSPDATVSIDSVPEKKDVVEPRSNITKAQEMQSESVNVGQQPIDVGRQPVKAKKKGTVKNKWIKAVVCLAIVAVGALVCNAAMRFFNSTTKLMLAAKESSGVEANKLINDEWCAGITELDLSGKQLTNQDIKKIGKFANLESLNIDNNNITGIDEICRIGTLKKLSAQNCQLTSFPRNIGVEELQLANNRIGEISAISGCKNLKILGLKGNAISNFNELKKCNNLEELDISEQVGDAAKRTITGLAELDNLKKVNISNCFVDDEITILASDNIALDIAVTDSYGNPIVCYGKKHIRYEKNEDSYMDINGDITEGAYVDELGIKKNYVSQSGKMLLEQAQPVGSSYWYLHRYDDDEKITSEMVFNDRQKLSPSYRNGKYERYAKYIYNGNTFLRKEIVADSSCGWSDKTVTIGNYYSRPLVFKNPDYVDRIDFTIKMYDIVGLNKTDDYYLYVKYVGSGWEKLGAYSLTADTETELSIALDSTRKFQQMLTIPVKSPKASTSWNNSISNLHLYKYSENYECEYDYESY